MINDSLESLLEVKLTDKKISPTLRYYTERLNVPGIQLVKDLRLERQEKQITIRNAENYLKAL
ncbi:hypothetical protein ACFL4D_02675 [Candidatus Margulisiibacteriota bacterium]